MKTLRESNPYMRDEDLREKLISRSVRSSCAVEGVKPSNRVGHIEIPRRGERKIYKTIKPYKATKA
jgi:hypothetical protein